MRWLDAALDLFIENGFAATRVDDIAKRAGLSKGAVYLYFPSKEAIIEALVRRALVPVASNAAAFVESFEGDPRIAITTVMTMLAGAVANPRFLAIPKLVVREVVNFPELAAMYRRELLDRALPVMEGLIRRGIDNGYLRPVDPALTIRSVVGAFMAHLILAEVFGVVPPDGLALGPAGYQSPDDHLRRAEPQGGRRQMNGFFAWFMGLVALIPGLGGTPAPGFTGYVEAKYVYVSPSAPGRSRP